MRFSAKFLAQVLWFYPQNGFTAGGPSQKAYFDWKKEIEKIFIAICDCFWEFGDGGGVDTQRNMKT